MEMTKSAEYLLSVLYAEYVERIENGYPKSKSIIFGSSENIFNSFFAEWNISDIDEAIKELSSVGFMNCLCASGVVVESSLRYPAIAYMESRYKNKINELLSTISALKTLILG